MTKSPEDMEFERMQVAYEQNCITFRSLNQLMWQIPLIAMTLTGGLWFGVTKVGDFALFKLALLFLAAVGNIGLILVLTRLRYLMQKYLDWIEAYNAAGYVSGEGTGFFTRSRLVRTVFQCLLGAAAAISLGLFGALLVNNEAKPSDTDRSLRSLAYYDTYARDLADNYESVQFEDIHPDLAAEITKSADKKPNVLDVGTGSGRDAAWMALHGADVVAVEPSEKMLALARNQHPKSGIRWIKDALPELNKVLNFEQKYDYILVSAVWMHLHPEDRPKALTVLSSLLKPAGKIYVSLRHGPAQLERGIYSVTADEIRYLAEVNGLIVKDLGQKPDLLGRPEVTWHAFQLAYGGT